MSTLGTWLRNSLPIERFLRKNAHRPSQWRAALEVLEDRSLLSVTAGFSSGALVVTGTSGSDTVIVRLVGSSLSVDGVSIKVQNSTVSQLSVDSVKQIEIKGLGGDDILGLIDPTDDPSVEQIKIPTFIDGGDGNDGLQGGWRKNTLSGGTGDDTFYGTDAPETVHGGDGNDRLQQGNSSNSAHGDNLNGDDGNDWIDPGEGGFNRVNGGNGNDTILSGLAGHETSSGGAGDDSMSGSNGPDLIHGDAGADTITGLDGDDTLYGDDGDDDIADYDGANILNGGKGNDTIHGGGGSGDSSLYGGSGNDSLFGDGTGSHSLAGGAGNDSLYADSGNDTLKGDQGEDYLSGGLGNDKLYGGTEADTLYGGFGNDTLYGDSGDDLMIGESADDLLSGGFGNDTLYGDAGNDTLQGDVGADEILGESGDDLLHGGSGNDSLDGGTGLDGLFGSGGTDEMAGGSDPDRFLFRTGSLDDLLDFIQIGNPAGDDVRIFFQSGDRSWSDKNVLQVDQAFAWLAARTQNNTMLQLQNGGELTFLRVKSLGSNPKLIVLADNNSKGRIRMADPSFKKFNTCRETVIHELGHNWDKENSNWQGFLDLSGWMARPELALPDGYLLAYSLDNVPQPWIYLSGTTFAKPYAHTNPFEDFASSLEIYYALAIGDSSANAASNWQSKWDFIDTFLDNLAT